MKRGVVERIVMIEMIELAAYFVADCMTSDNIINYLGGLRQRLHGLSPA